MLKQIKNLRFAHKALAAAAAGLLILIVAGAWFFLHEQQRNVPVLLYHSISDTSIGLRNLSVPVKGFDAEMKYLSDNGYTPLYLNEDFHRARRPVVITFDDGYTDNYVNAYPILKKYHMKATVFMIAGNIGKPGYLTADQMRRMADAVSFQSHTVSHIRLSRVSLRRAERECAESKKIITGVTNRPVYALSYPEGDFNAAIEKITARHYSMAVTTMEGFETRLSGNYRIRRMTVDPLFTTRDFSEVLDSNGKI